MFTKVADLFRQHYKLAWFVILANAALALTKTVLDPLVMKWLVDDALGQKNLDLFLLLVGVAIGVGICFRLSSYVVHMLRQKLINAITRSKTQAMVSSFFGLPYSKIAERGEGYFISRVYDEPAKLADRGTRLSIAMFENVVCFIGAFAICIYLSWEVTLALLLIVPVLFGLSRKFGRKIYRQSEREGENEALFRGDMVRCLETFKLSNLFGLSGTATASAIRVLDNYLDSNLERNKTSEIYQTWSNIFLSLAESMVLLIAASAVFLGSMTVGGLLAYMSGFWKMMNALVSLIDKTPEVSNLFAYADRLDEFRAQQVNPERNEHRHVQLAGADIGYGDKTIVRNLDLDIATGEKVLLLGQNGTGKTTVLNALAGFLPALNSKVFIPSQNNVSALLPPLNFFRGTLAEHLRLEQLNAEQLKQVNAMLIDFNLFDKLDRDPHDFSEGEKRKAMIALALIKPAELYLFDEPLAAVDIESKHSIMCWIQRMTTGKTLLMVLHGDEEFHPQFDRVIQLNPVAMTMVA
jgi:ABC-type multidrug transport system fused ATPase/permease subunit